MLIDWFTVVAQVCNFLILVWLMKRYLYRPILAAIDSREKKIAGGLKDAQEKMVHAATLRDEFQKKNDAFEQDRSALWQKLDAEGKAEKQKLLDQARADAQTLRAKLEAAIQADRKSLEQEIRDGVKQEVFAITRKALADLAAADIEIQMTKVFIERMHNMDASVKNALAQALQSGTEPVQVRSAFALQDQQQEAIRQVLKENFGLDKQIDFDTSPALVAGMELSAGGQKLAWSIDDYLESLDKRVDTLLTPTGPDTSKPNPVDASAGELTP